LHCRAWDANAEAIPLFKRVVDAEPKNAGALTNYALALVQQGQAKEGDPTLHTRGLADAG